MQLSNMDVDLSCDSSVNKLRVVYTKFALLVVNLYVYAELINIFLQIIL